jgi:hypothetical protein
MIIIVIIFALVNCSHVFITHTTTVHDRVAMEKGLLDSYSLGARTRLTLLHLAKNKNCKAPTLSNFLHHIFPLSLVYIIFLQHFVLKG